MILLILLLAALGVGVMTLKIISRQVDEAKSNFFILLVDCATLTMLFAGLWLLRLLLPPVVAWGASGIASLIIFSYRKKVTGQENVNRPFGVLFISLVLFYYSVNLLDIAVSTQEFQSDRELLLATLHRCLSKSSVLAILPFAIFASLGQIISLRMIKAYDSADDHVIDR